MKRLLRLGVVVLAVTPLALLRSDAVRAMLVQGMEYLREAGPLGVALFFGMEAVAGLLVVPIWLMAAVAGYIYGFPLGVLVAAPGVAVAGLSGFGAGRLLFARGFTPSFVHSPYWKAVQRATTREGLKVALLLRATPVVPQNFLHYLLSSTALPARHFALGTLLGLLPVTAVQVYLGSLVKSAAELVAGQGQQVGGPLRWVLPGLAVAATVGGGVLLARVGRRMLKETLDAAESAEKAEKTSDCHSVTG